MEKNVSKQVLIYTSGKYGATLVFIFLATGQVNTIEYCLTLKQTPIGMINDFNYGLFRV